MKRIHPTARQLMHAPLIAAIAVSALCTAAGNGSAETPSAIYPETTPSIGTSAPETFEIWNLTGGDITLENYQVYSQGASSSDDPFQPGFALSDRNGGEEKIAPGRSFKMTVVDRDTFGEATFSGLRAGNPNSYQKWVVDMSNKLAGGRSISCESRTQHGACGGKIGGANNVITIVDPRDTFIRVPATDKARSDQLTTDLCGNIYKSDLRIDCTDSANALSIGAGATTWTLEHK